MTKRRLVIFGIAFVSITTVLVAVYFAVFTSDNSGKEMLQSLGIELTLPQGWKTKGEFPQYFSAAPTQAELENAIENGRLGPKFVIEGPETSDTRGFYRVAGLDLYEEPQAVTVDSRDGAAITLTDARGQITRYVVVNVDAERAYLFRLSAPADQWQQHRPALEAILTSIRFVSSK